MTTPKRDGSRWGWPVFICTAFTTFTAEQLLWDGQFITYPMFRRVRELDERHFVQVHQEYVKSLGAPTYLPMGLYLLSNLAFLFVRPREVPLRFPLAMNLLNAVGVASTFAQLVPIHVRIDTTERATAEDVEKLIAYNRIRFGLVGVNSAIMLYLLGKAPRDGRDA
jgi:hypothetical protein